MIYVKDYMQPAPFTIGADQTAGEALSRMVEKSIRHLPVLFGGSLVGIVSDRDLNLVRALPDGLRMRVDDVMAPGVFVVPETTPLHEVVLKMAQDKLGAALVQDKAGKLTGIFTAIDGMQILSECLKTGRVP